MLDNAYDMVSEEEKRVHERLNSCFRATVSWLDVKKPLLPQVKKMTNREFLAFVRHCCVRRPRYIEDTDGI